MRRIASLVVLVVLLVVVMIPAEAAIGIGATLPLYSVDHQDAVAGGNYLISFDSEAGITDGHAAWYLDGALTVLSDTYGVFDDLKYMSVECMVLRIDENHLKAVESQLRDGKKQPLSDGVLALKDGKIIVRRDGIGPGQYALVTNITQDQSTKNSHGIFASLGQLVGIKKTRHITKTDVVAMRFEITDASSTIERICRLQFKCPPDKLDGDQLYILRAAFYQETMRNRIGFAESLGLLDLVSQGYAAKVQGYNPPLSRDQGPNPEVVQMQKIISDLQNQLKSMAEQQRRDEEARLERERTVAKIAAESAQLQKTVSWSLKLPCLSETGWAIWVDGSDYPLTVTGDTVHFKTVVGTHWVEFVQAGGDFNRWRKCVITHDGQQIQSTEVQ